MAQCYQCGSSVYMTDRFCMECGAEHPSLSAAARAAASSTAPDAAPQNALPAQPGPNASGLAPANNAAQEGETISCPKCGSSLPRGARFCGDCGTPLTNTAGAVQPTTHPTRVATAALPDPIPPLNANAAAKPASGPAQSVLPPFRAANWANQPLPQPEAPGEITDKTAAPLSHAPAAPPIMPPAPTPAWSGPPAPSAQQPASAWAAPPEPPAWGAPQAPAWQPGLLQGSSKAAEFSAPNPVPPGPMTPPSAQGPAPPQPAAGSNNPSQAFVQAISAMPMAPALPAMRAPRRQARYPREQVITMLVAAIVTVLSALGGVIVLLLSHR